MGTIKLKSLPEVVRLLYTKYLGYNLTAISSEVFFINRIDLLLIQNII